MVFQNYFTYFELSQSLHVGWAKSKDHYGKTKKKHQITCTFHIYIYIYINSSFCKVSFQLHSKAPTFSGRWLFNSKFSKFLVSQRSLRWERPGILLLYMSQRSLRWERPGILLLYIQEQYSRPFPPQTSLWLSHLRLLCDTRNFENFSNLKWKCPVTVDLVPATVQLRGDTLT